MSRPNIPVPPKPSSSLSKTGSEEGGTQAGHLNYEGVTVRQRQNMESTMDPKKLKRLLSNRASAQKSRLKKAQYVDDLMRKTNELQREVSMLRSLVGKASEQKQFLENEHKELQECTSALLQRHVSTQGEIEINRLEVERLKLELDSFSLMCYENYHA